MKALVALVIAALTLTLAAASAGPRDDFDPGDDDFCPTFGCGNNGRSLNGIWDNGIWQNGTQYQGMNMQGTRVRGTSGEATIISSVGLVRVELPR